MSHLESVNELNKTLAKELGHEYVELTEEDIRESEDSLRYFETVTYPKMHAEAKALGDQAREDGLPRECNLTGKFAHEGTILKDYKSAWEQGYDKWEIPGVFKQMEDHLKEQPLRPMTEEDL